MTPKRNGCTQNHNTPYECATSDCAPVGQIRLIDLPKQRMTPDETRIQWLKILGLSIALGVMGYQTYLMKLISEK